MALFCGNKGDGRKEVEKRGGDPAACLPAGACTLNEKGRHEQEGHELLWCGEGGGVGHCAPLISLRAAI